VIVLSLKDDRIKNIFHSLIHSSKEVPKLGMADKARRIAGGNME
jgi:hypothetical protein